MATPQLQLQPPENFDFQCPDGWLKWKRRFLSTQSEPAQVNTLLYCMGEEAYDVLTSTTIAEDDREKYAPVLAKVDEFFKVRTNKTLERAKFNRRDQWEGESVDSYVTALYALVEHCEYGAMKDELLRDRIVVSIRDKKHLQVDPDLTLEKAKRLVRQREAVKEQREEMESPGSFLEVRRQQGQRRSNLKPRGGAGGSQGGAKCSRCGRGRHQAGAKCPASNAVCHKCHKRGHFKAQCSSTGVAEVDQLTQQIEEFTMESMELAYLDTVMGEPKTPWMTTVELENTKIEIKLDTAAGVTAINEQTYRRLRKVALSATSRCLYGPARQKLEILDYFKGHMKGEQHSAETDVYVVRGLQSNLLGLPSIVSLELVKRVCATGVEPELVADIKACFPKVFNGLGTMGEEYTIKLQEGAKPHAIYTPRNVPLSLRDKAEKELQRMEELGVIEKVTEPTPWVAGMVATPKPKSDGVRICVDLRHLNESVLREVYHIPKVDDMLAQMSGAKLFSKLDANSGFWRIPLAKESRKLTTFLTPSGRYCCVSS